MIDFETTLRASDAFKNFKRDVDNANLAHAYMLVTPDVKAMNSLLLLYAATLFCPNGVCLECAECAKILHFNHSDVIHINREEKKTISATEIDDMIEDSYVLPNEGGKKLYIVHLADNMTSSAQNKLLKTLEEPPKSVTIILGVKNEAALLDTVKSRVRKIYLDSFSSKEIFAEMNKFGASKDKAQIAAACCNGSLGTALEILMEDNYSAAFDEVFSVLNKVTKSADIVSVLNDKALSKEKLPVFLDVLSHVFRDMLMAKTDKNLISVKNKEEEIVRLSAGYSELAISRILFLINEERKRLKANVSAMSVAENLLFGILEVKYICQ